MARLIVVYVPKGLTWTAALALARLQLPRGADYRGFTYDPTTGRAAFR